MAIYLEDCHFIGCNNAARIDGRAVIRGGSARDIKKVGIEVGPDAEVDVLGFEFENVRGTAVVQRERDEGLSKARQAIFEAEIAESIRSDLQKELAQLEKSDGKRSRFAAYERLVGLASSHGTLGQILAQCVRPFL